MKKPKVNNSLADQIGDFGGTENTEDEGFLEEADAALEQVDKESHSVTGMLGTKILTPNERRKQMFGNSNRPFATNTTAVGENILERAEIRSGWIPVDRSLLGDRDVFYPESWEFMVRPATVEAIKSWSTIDENNARSVNLVFNEILKSCLSIKDTATDTNIPWNQLNSWDRFFFILLIRNYTFAKGENVLKYEEDCSSCDEPITFTLDATSLYYDMPDPEVMKYWDRDTRTWIIDSEEFGLNRGVITLYSPTIEKDDNILNYITEVYQDKGHIKRELEIFIKYLVWLLPKAPKDMTLLKRKVREVELEYRGWSIDEFNFIDEVIRNITITPSQKLKIVCPNCNEEVTSDIRFPDGIRSIFAVPNKFKKFGTK